FSDKSLNRLSMVSFVRMEISPRESHKCGAEVTCKGVAGEGRVKGALPVWYSRTTMQPGRTTFCRVPFPYGFCGDAAIICSPYKNCVRRGEQSWGPRPSTS